MNTRHWNWIQGFALAALLPLFAACSSEGDELLQGEEKQPVQVNITRATMNDGNDWSWQDNDQIGLNITNYGESTPNSYTLTYNNNVWTSNPATIEATLPATIQAWWPASASVTKFNYSYTSYDEPYQIGSNYIKGTVDQSDQTKLASCDWMVAATPLASPSLSINFEHQLCRVEIKITKFEGWPEGEEPMIQELCFFTKVENDDGSGTGDWLDVKPYERDGSYIAIISSYVYSSHYNSPLMKIKIDDDDYYVYVSDEVEDGKRLVNGNSYTFNLTIKNRNSNTVTTRSTYTQECELELIEVEDMNKN